MTLTIPSQLGYVAGALGLTFVVHHIYMPFNIGKARKKYNVKFPDLYATPGKDITEENAFKFNCIQRGHQNSLENLPTFNAMLIVAGLKHPIVACVAAVVYNIGRIMYFNGYATGDPKKRMQGAAYALGLLTLFGTCIKMTVDMFLT